MAFEFEEEKIHWNVGKMLYKALVAVLKIEDASHEWVTMAKAVFLYLENTYINRWKV